MTKKKRRPAAALPAKAAVPETPRTFLWPVLCLALVLRFIYLQMSQASPFYEPLLLDAKYYHDWALRVAHGDFGRTVFYGLPLYPFFLGALYKLTGASLFGVKLIQTFLGVATVFFVYRIAEKLSEDRRVPLIAGLIAACYGPLIFHEGIFIPEAVGVPLYAAAFYYAMDFAEAPSTKKALMLGVLFGLCMLAKAGIFLFVLIFLASLAWNSPENRRSVLACAAAFLLTLAPVTAHNVYHGKDLVFLTSHSGFNFYVGNNERAEGVFNAPEGTGTNVDAQIEDSRAVAERAMGRELKPSEVSKYWSGKAWEFIRSRPGKFLELCARKFALFFDAREISDVDDYQFAALFDPFLRLPWPNFAFLGPLFFLGLVTGYPKFRHRTTLLVWLGGYVAGMMAFFVNARYRLPLLPVMIPVAALGLARFITDFIEWKGKSLAVSVAILVAAAGFTRLALVGTDFSRDYINAGDAWVLKGDPERALPLYDKALEIDPRSSKAALAKALAFTRLGRSGDAETFYQKSLEIDPHNSQAHNNLGLWYEQNGRLAEAESHFLEAIRIKPNSPQAHNNLGMVYGKRGAFAEAIREFEEAIRYNPVNARFYTNLGLIRFQMGEKEKARALWEKALSLDPGFEDARRALQLSSR